MTALLVAIFILIIAIIILLIYNFVIFRKVEEIDVLTKKVKNLSIVQDFINIISESSAVNTKINKVNDMIIEKYGIKYSTIVVFNGAEYIIKATNVEEKHWKVLQSLNEIELFKDSISTSLPKYVTVNKEEERLEYQTMDFARVKSAIFFPLYIENVYIGYWIIESPEPHKFDNIDLETLNSVKDNIIAILKNTSNQETLEALVRKDKFTNLYNAEYLYGKGKNLIDKHIISTVCMFNIINIGDINEEFGREYGNEIIKEVSNTVKNSISDDYIFVRYIGSKFLIVFSGVNPEETVDFVKDIKQQIENLKVLDVDEEYAEIKTNFVISRYYKGTRLEEVNRRLEQYLIENEKYNEDIDYI